ncbi:hypothetical protein [Sphingopyxis sp. PET50]|uniref:hypothetical protein n=1 Tax=Sphingopyxis sp. PET50 TaxID=2976533 RepID=UPI0021AFA301|nr:hypothetical protein [Sphingopyxis sp. PET50]
MNPKKTCHDPRIAAIAAAGRAPGHLGDPTDPAMPASLFLDSDAVIAALSPAIPDPATLKAPRAAKGK